MFLPLSIFHARRSPTVLSNRKGPLVSQGWCCPERVAEADANGAPPISPSDLMALVPLLSPVAKPEACSQSSTSRG